MDEATAALVVPLSVPSLVDCSRSWEATLRIVTNDMLKQDSLSIGPWARLEG